MTTLKAKSFSFQTDRGRKLILFSESVVSSELPVFWPPFIFSGFSTTSSNNWQLGIKQCKFPSRRCFVAYIFLIALSSIVWSAPSVVSMDEIVYSTPWSPWVKSPIVPAALLVPLPLWCPWTNPKIFQFECCIESFRFGICCCWQLFLFCACENQEWCGRSSSLSPNAMRRVSPEFSTCLPVPGALHVRPASLPGKEYHIGRVGDQDTPAGPASTERRRRQAWAGRRRPIMIVESVDDMSSATVSFAVE